MPFSPLPVCPVIPAQGTVRSLSEVNPSTCVVTITSPGPLSALPCLCPLVFLGIQTHVAPPRKIFQKPSSALATNGTGCGGCSFLNEPQWPSLASVRPARHQGLVFSLLLPLPSTVLSSQPAFRLVPTWNHPHTSSTSTWLEPQTSLCHQWSCGTGPGASPGPALCQLLSLLSRGVFTGTFFPPAPIIFSSRPASSLTLVLYLPPLRATPFSPGSTQRPGSRKLDTGRFSKLVALTPGAVLELPIVCFIFSIYF